MAYFAEEEFKEIRKVAQEMGGAMGFADEAGVGVMTRSGRTWGEVNSPPVVKVNTQRGGHNVRSLVSASGELLYRMEEQRIDGKVYIQFLERALRGRARPQIIIADQAAYHTSKEVDQFIQKNSQRTRLFFLPAYSPELDPDERVWNEIKHRHLEKQPIRNKFDLRRILGSLLSSLQRKKEKIQSFFKLPNTRYAAIPEPAS